MNRLAAEFFGGGWLVFGSGRSAVLPAVLPSEESASPASHRLAIAEETASVHVIAAPATAGFLPREGACAKSTCTECYEVEVALQRSPTKGYIEEPAETH
jgi:hypothetical protein